MVSVETHHVGIVVSDLEEALSFYRDTLGLEVESEFTLSEDGIGTAIGVEGATGQFAHLDGGGTRVELIEYEPAGDDASAAAINQLGAKHVGFAVDDIDAFYEDLPDDADPVSDPQRVEVGSDILFFRDPDGNFIEVVDG